MDTNEQGINDKKNNQSLTASVLASSSESCQQESDISDVNQQQHNPQISDDRDITNTYNRTERLSGSGSSGWGSPHDPSARDEPETANVIVRLIQEDDTHSLDWSIRPEFYTLDVAREENFNEDEIADDEASPRSSDNPVNFQDDGDYEEGDYDEEDEDGEADIEMDDDDMDYGFVLAPGDNISSDSESGDDDDDDDDGNANYDRSLPVEHRYLGGDFEESRGLELYMENSFVTLPIINLVDVVILPGQRLPLSPAHLHYRIQHILRQCLKDNTKTIGIIHNAPSNPIGTTIEVRSYSIRGPEFFFICEGRQRFQLVSEPFEVAKEGRVKILPEITLGSPYPQSLLSMKSFSPSKPLSRFNQLLKHPIHVYQRFDALHIMNKIMYDIKSWIKMVDITDDPKDFSYWMAANLPMSNEGRVKALSFKCTEARLLWLLDLLEHSISLACTNCKNVICYKSDVFPMSQNGAQNSFINPNGFIHDTLTVLKVRGVTQEAFWSQEFTWFPGYEWRYAYCSLCRQHLGWCYRSIDRKTKPHKFFGLRGSSVVLHNGLIL